MLFFTGSGAVSETNYKYGVYLKPNGHLFIVQKGKKNKYELDANKPIKNKLLKALYKAQGLPQPVLVFFSDSLGWGPTSFINKAEYLGPF